MKTIYIAGPMTGLVGFNHKAFDFAAKYFCEQGWNVINPVDLDIESGGPCIRSLPSDTDWNKMPDGLIKDEVIRRDVDAVMKADAIALLIGWGNSMGARAEASLARWRGLDVFYANVDFPAS